MGQWGEGGLSNPRRGDKTEGSGGKAAARQPLFIACRKRRWRRRLGRRAAARHPHSPPWTASRAWRSCAGERRK
eukprot:1119976-Alexandrium_andersonii.AAC.1